MKVTVLLASPNEESKSLALAKLVVDEFSNHYDVDLSIVDVYRLGAGFSTALSRDDVDPSTQDALKTVENTDVLIPAMPVFRGSYPGLFKHFIDLVDRYALANTVVLPVATAGSDLHGLVIDHVLRPLFGFLQAHVAPMGIFASSAQFDGTMLLDSSVYSRIQIAVADLAPLLVEKSR